LNRPEEALEILQEGIAANPTYWRFRLYVGAIVHKQRGRFDDMIRLLEDAVLYPDCPTLVKSVLANIYKERKNYKRALEIWIGILEGRERDPWYREQAQKQIAELRQKLGI
jgi:tetratricopeptide (TPR) repeat protein